MRELIQSMPQGFLWYPVVLAMIVVAGRTILLARRGASRNVGTGGRPATRLEEFDDRVNQRASHAGLERSCIGMLLTAAGYSGYSINNCRDYLERGAPEPVDRAIREHLDGVPEQPVPRGQLPSRIETVLSCIERQMEG
jgi:hypothetical protein